MQQIIDLVDVGYILLSDENTHQSVNFPRITMANLSHFAQNFILH
jgi:hypothetical protein